jgi:FtsZ-binding cell division protein ZapB
MGRAMAGRDEGAGGVSALTAGRAPTGEGERAPGGPHAGGEGTALCREVEALLDELNRLYGADPALPAGFTRGGPNLPYLYFLRRRIHAIRADNLLLRGEVERLARENDRLRQEADRLRRQTDELARVNRVLEEELRQAKLSRGWRLANALRRLFGRRPTRMHVGGPAAERLFSPR